MKRPLVSAIVTTKNNVNTIEPLLKSLIKQLYQNLEIIVVDNFSTDQTATKAFKYTKKIYNKGPERSAQRNFGASKSKGKYLLFLDSDMELTKGVVGECIELAYRGINIITIPEKTVGQGFIQNIRKFERQMYEGDSSIELARFYDKELFLKTGGYDENLTGPEDYDLFLRASKNNQTGRIKSYILHHEEGLTLGKLLKKKFYYASKGALYAEKHPELIKTQGTILFRKAYLNNWKKFIRDPFTGLAFLFIRILEMIWAVSGYISVVGLWTFTKKLLLVFSNTSQAKN